MLSLAAVCGDGGLCAEELVVPVEARARRTQISASLSRRQQSFYLRWLEPCAASCWSAGVAALVSRRLQISRSPPQYRSRLSSAFKARSQKLSVCNIMSRDR
jgi:hypothetical protein